MALINSDEDFRLACSYLVAQGQLLASGNRFIDPRNRKVWDEAINGNVNITPSNATLEAALDNALINLAVVNSRALERATIVQKAALATEYMADIRKVLNAIIDHDIASTSLAIRYASLSGIVDTQVSTAFKNRFNDALKAEQNLDMSLLGILGLTSNQQRTYLSYLRIFVNQYALLALFGSM